MFFVSLCEKESWWLQIEKIKLCKEKICAKIYGINYKEAEMGEVRGSFIIQNEADIIMAEAGYIDRDKIRQVETSGLVDTGAVMLMLPQDMVEMLGLPVWRKVIVAYADERKEARDVAGRIRIGLGDRFMFTDCIVGPPLCEPLIGQIILEALDLIVDPGKQTIGPRPESPYLPLLKMK